MIRSQREISVNTGKTPMPPLSFASHTLSFQLRISEGSGFFTEAHHWNAFQGRVHPDRLIKIQRALAAAAFCLSVTMRETRSMTFASVKGFTI